jgi:nucleotide-binding universal stress UspA family protein
MEEELGWSIKPERAASDLVSQQGKRLMRVARRASQKLLKILLPKQLEDFSSPGEWHDKKRVDGDSLFSDILVAFNGSPESWIAVEQAIHIAEIENADVRGLVVRMKKTLDPQNENQLSFAFSERLQQSGLRGNLAFAQGDIAETITDRAKFNDLVVLKLSHPPSPKIFQRFSSGMRIILRRSSRPVLAVRDQISPMEHLLLAYDGSPKGKEALFVSAYLASKYNKKLTVLVVEKDIENGQKLIKEAENYLGDCCKNSVFKQDSGRVAREILQTQEEEYADLIVMGGYGLSPIFEALFGSTVDSVLRATRVPVIVCQ